MRRESYFRWTFLPIAIILLELFSVVSAEEPSGDFFAMNSSQSHLASSEYPESSAIENYSDWGFSFSQRGFLSSRYYSPSWSDAMEPEMSTTSLAVGSNLSSFSKMLDMADLSEYSVSDTFDSNSDFMNDGFYLNDGPVIVRGQAETTYWRTLDPYNPTYVAQVTDPSSIAPTLPTTPPPAATPTPVATPAPAPVASGPVVNPVPAAETNNAIAPTISNTSPTYTPSVDKVMKFWNKLSFEYTYLARKTDLSIHEFDFATRFAIPCNLLANTSAGQSSVFYIAPRFSFELWNLSGKEYGKRWNSSMSTFDTSLDFLYDAQFGEFGVEARVALGLASTFKKVKGDAFYVRGRGMGKLIITEDGKVTATGGVIYYGRNEFKLLPSGGIIWRPNPANVWRIVFPDPRFSRHLGKYNDTDWWGYIRGDIGGGRWYMDAGDEYMKVDYNDYRVALGISFTTYRNMTGEFEVGGSFRRKFYAMGQDLFKPGSTLFLKAGLQF